MVTPEGCARDAHVLSRWTHRAVFRLQRSRAGGKAPAVDVARRGARGDPPFRRRHVRTIDDIVEELHVRALTAGVSAAHGDKATAPGAVSAASPPGVLRLVFSKRGQHVVDVSVPPPVMGSLSGDVWGCDTPGKARGAVAPSRSHVRSHRRSCAPERLDASARERHTYVWWRGNHHGASQVGMWRILRVPHALALCLIPCEEREMPLPSTHAHHSCHSRRYALRDHHQRHRVAPILRDHRHPCLAHVAAARESVEATKGTLCPTPSYAPLK